ncbi:MAG: septum formation initiator family protein [Bdellovibrionales bacterium]|nr:septum formation initiator family protein [Bdellovibrionales bacterium]
MNKVVPGLILILFAVLFGHTLFSDKSYAKLNSLDKSLAYQQEKNIKLNEEVLELKKRLVGLSLNDRVLEKTARNELGMAREDELIFIFEKNSLNE